MAAMTTTCNGTRRSLSAGSLTTGWHGQIEFPVSGHLLPPASPRETPPERTPRRRRPTWRRHLLHPFGT